MSAGRVAVVTGAGSGLGRAISQALGGDGWSVVLAGRREEPLRRTAGSLAGGATSVVVPTDVGRPESVQALFSEVGRRFERLDLLVNNAGTFGPSASPENVAYEEWRSTVDVNLTGSFLCAQAAFRMMRDQRPQGGRIINNGSLSAHTPRPNSIAYTATKHAITGLTKSLSLDGRRYGIACGQIDIGNAATEMTAAMSGGVPQADGSIAVEPTTDAGHVARAVLYMAGLPLDANVLSMTVMATAMPFVGRG
ncbi:SDR family oxidoreductase [Streptosporangium subroseum]|uniref:SDR family oxidoreductase n=1 Tax=Streptosporangium subroseum TaxID=106412 RepID=UPI003447B500